MPFPFLSTYTLYPLTMSVSLQALDFLQQNSRQLNFLRARPLPVSGAFHTQLMELATEPLRDVLQQVEVSLSGRLTARSPLSFLVCRFTV